MLVAFLPYILCGSQANLDSLALKGKQQFMTHLCSLRTMRFFSSNGAIPGSGFHGYTEGHFEGWSSEEKKPQKSVIFAEILLPGDH